MDAEGTFDGCFQDFTINPSTEIEPPSQKPPSPSSTPENAYFDCNICLDFASDPVVTICGHLYCWPCIYRWLHLDAGPRNCPVCKFSLSESSLVPLYGRGLDAKPHDRISGIPKRPRDHQNLVAGHRLPPQPRQGLQMYQNYNFYDNGRVNHMGVLHSTAGAVLGEMALSMLPWAFRNQELYTSLNQSSAASRRGQRWRQELRAECWLHQLWLFLFCCAFLCLVFF